ncbi:MAG: hypothetical protein ABGZ36_13190 [Actinomycetota bacterium]
MLDEELLSLDELLLFDELLSFDDESLEPLLAVPLVLDDEPLLRVSVT